MTFGAGGVNFNPVKPADKPNEGWAKPGMSRAEFNAWLDKTAVPHGVGIWRDETGAYGSQGTSQVRVRDENLTQSDRDALWDAYQRYGTLDPNEAYGYAEHQHNQSFDATHGAGPPQFTNSAAGPQAAGTPGTTAAATSGATGAPAPTGAKGATAPDLNTAIKNVGDPALRAILEQVTAQGATGTVTLWSGVPVDPQAQVNGTVMATATTNTMDASGRMIHGVGSQAGIGLVPKTQSADAWLKGLYKMSPQDLAALQHQLWEHGWYAGSNITDPSMIEYGRPDAETVAAYGAALGETARYNAAGRTGINIDDVIGMGSPTSKLAKKKGEPFMRTSVADLNSQLQSEAQQRIGRDLSPEELAQFASGYRGREDAARRTLIAAGADNRTAGVDGPGSPTNEADAYIDTHNLADRIAYGAAVRQQAFFDMLKSPV